MYTRLEVMPGVDFNLYRAFFISFRDFIFYKKEK